MNTRQLRGSLLVLLSISGALLATNAVAQTVTYQVLDRVGVYTGDTAIEMSFNQPNPTFPYTPYQVHSTSGFQACSLTATDGLYCLDGNDIKHWANPLKAPASTDGTLFNCTDNALQLTACTGLTVDLNGNIWLAGQNKKKTYNLVKVISRGAQPTVTTDYCPTSWSGPFGLADPNNSTVRYYACSWATGRPLLVDITAIGGDAAKEFDPGSGIVGLEQRKAVTFFPDTTDPKTDKRQITSLGSGKSDWGLLGNEQLQAVTVLPASNRVLVTTTKARILSRDVSGVTADGTSGGTLLSAHDIPLGTPASGCASDPNPQYGLRASAKSGLLYVTDSGNCDIIGLNPSPKDTSGNVQVNDPWPEIYVPPVSTTQYVPADYVQAGSTDPVGPLLPPVGPMIAPGQGVDMTTCDPDCQPVQGASLLIPSSTLVSTESGLTLFQIVGIPDCRWSPDEPACKAALTDHPGALLVLDPPGRVYYTADGALATGSHPEGEYLNVRWLLPEDVQTALVNELKAENPGINTDLLELWISPNYRGQQDKDGVYRFDAFFGVTEQGVRFQGTFGLEFWVDQLTTGQLVPNYNGCVLAQDLSNPDYYPAADGPWTTLKKLLRWDVMTKVSETVVGGDAQTFLPAEGGAHVDTLINTGCGSSRGTSFGFSLVPYNLDVTSDTDTYIPPADPATETVKGFRYCPDDPSVFAHLLGKLYDDFTVTTQVYSCSQAYGSQPIDDTTCSTLLAQIDNGRDKLQKCLDAAYQPKTSAGSQNCQSFASQLSNVEATIDSTLDPWYASTDPNNRRGEAKARLLVIRHVFTDKFMPSVPGITDAAATTTNSCPAPVKLLGSP